MNTILLIFSFILVATVNGTEESNIGFQNPLLSEVKTIPEKKIAEVPTPKKTIFRNPFQNKLSVEKKHKIIPDLKSKKVQKEFVRNLFNNKKNSKNSAFILPKKNFQKRIWRFTNKNGRNSIKTVFPSIEKDQKKQKWNIFSKESSNKNMTFSGLSGENKFEELIRKFSTGTDSDINKDILPILLNKTDTLKRENMKKINKTTKSLQNSTRKSLQSIHNNNNNTMKNKLEETKQDSEDIGKLASIGLNMLSNLLNQQKMEGFVDRFFNKQLLNNSETWNATLIPNKNDIHEDLHNTLGKSLQKQNTNDAFNKNEFVKFLKHDFNNTSTRTLRSHKSDLLNEENSEIETKGLIKIKEYDRKSSLTNIKDIVDTIPDTLQFRGGISILGFLTDGAMEVLAMATSAIIKDAVPKSIKFVFNKLKDEKLFATVIIYAITIGSGVVFPLILGSPFIFLTAAFTTVVIPVITGMLMEALTPEKITEAYLYLIKTFDEALDIDKVFKSITKALISLVKLKV